MAGSTNFKQWDPNLTNMEADMGYAADPLRQGGAQPGVLPKETLNKALYQATALATAFAQALAAKGYTINDGSAGDFNALVAALANIMTSVEMNAEAAARVASDNAEAAARAAAVNAEAAARAAADAAIVAGTVANASALGGKHVSGVYNVHVNPGGQAVVNTGAKGGYLAWSAVSGAAEAIPKKLSIWYNPISGWIIFQNLTADVVDLEVHWLIIG